MLNIYSRDPSRSSERVNLDLLDPPIHADINPLSTRSLQSCTGITIIDTSFSFYYHIFYLSGCISMGEIRPYSGRMKFPGRLELGVSEKDPLYDTLRKD